VDYDINVSRHPGVKGLIVVNDIYYPPVADGLKSSLETIRLHLIEDAAYLTHQECPYPAELRAYLTGLIGRTEGGDISLPYPPAGAPMGTKTPEYTPTELEAEAERLFFELGAFGDKVKDGEAAAQASYFRVAAGLLEKILSAKEKAANLKEFGRLIAFLSQFAEDEMTADLRAKFMDGIKAFSER
jgi:hypothetical protein